MLKKDYPAAEKIENYQRIVFLELSGIKKHVLMYVKNIYGV